MIYMWHEYCGGCAASAGAAADRAATTTTTVGATDATVAMAGDLEVACWPASLVKASYQ